MSFNHGALQFIQLFSVHPKRGHVSNGIGKQNSVCSEYFNQERVIVDVSIVMEVANFYPVQEEVK